MENFETHIRKYKREFERMEKENAVLYEKAVAGEKVGIKKQLDENKLRSDYNNLRRFVDSLPEEIKQQALLPQKTQNQQK